MYLAKDDRLDGHPANPAALAKTSSESMMRNSASCRWSDPMTNALLHACLLISQTFDIPCSPGVVLAQRCGFFDGTLPPVLCPRNLEKGTWINLVCHF